MKLNLNQSRYLPFRFMVQEYFKQHHLGRFENFLNIRGRYQGKHFPAACEYTLRLSETYELVKADSAFEIENNCVSLMTIERIFSLDAYAQTLADTLEIPWEGIPEYGRPEDPYKVKKIADVYLNELKAHLGLLNDDFELTALERHLKFQKNLSEEEMFLHSRLLTFANEIRISLSPNRVNEVLKIGILFDLLELEEPLGFRLKCHEVDYRHYVQG